ncbi:MAG: ABC transporter ATP-binding protein [Lachnospiraceae bacterium]|nr:ABC transporter ATP-binding protein [Lachnospiraceae bacterium]
MKKILIKGTDLCKSFKQGEKNVMVLNKICVDIYEGDFTVIMGASGAGKSTLLYALSGMDGITGGKVEFGGEAINGYNEKKMAELRAKEFGFVFQQTHLVSNLTLFENVAVAGYVGKRHNAKKVQEKAEQLLVQMHADGAKDRMPSQVSGGEAQRAAIARAMINNPKIVFADEPTGALNKANSEEVLNLLTELNRNGQSIVMVTHDIRAAIHGNRLLYLEDGNILAELSLSAYEEKNAKGREAKVNNWLTDLQW